MIPREDGHELREFRPPRNPGIPLAGAAALLATLNEALAVPPPRGEIGAILAFPLPPAGNGAGGNQARDYECEF